jgi:hypothetical protein
MANFANDETSVFVDPCRMRGQEIALAHQGLAGAQMRCDDCMSEPLKAHAHVFPSTDGNRAEDVRSADSASRLVIVRGCVWIKADINGACNLNRCRFG